MYFLIWSFFSFQSHVEPHYGTEYHVEKIDSSILHTWHNCGINSELEVPRPNDLIDKGKDLFHLFDSKGQLFKNNENSCL